VISNASQRWSPRRERSMIRQRERCSASVARLARGQTRCRLALWMAVGVKGARRNHLKLRPIKVVPGGGGKPFQGRDPFFRCVRARAHKAMSHNHQPQGVSPGSIPTSLQNRG
jgi:hypothetical protein